MAFSSMRVRRTSVALAALVLVAACGGPAEEGGGAGGTSVKVGVIIDRSGPTAYVQVPAYEGFDAYIQAVNEDGGVNGNEIELVVEDDEFDAAVGVAAYRRLVDQENVSMLYGFGSSDVQSAVAPLITRDGIAALGSVTTLKLMLDPVNENFFNIAPNLSDSVDALVGAGKEASGKDNPRVVTINSGVASGTEYTDLVGSIEGIDYVGDHVLAADSTSADAVVRQVIAEKPDFIAFHGSAGSANATLKSQQKFGSAIPMYGYAPSAGVAVWSGIDEELGAKASFVLGVTPAPTEVDGTAQLEEDAAAAGYDDSASDPGFVYGYVAAHVFVAALEEAGDAPTRASILEALAGLANVDTSGLSGDIGYGDGDRIGLVDQRPYTLDYATQTYKPEGEFEDYADYITHRYGG